MSTGEHPRHWNGTQMAPNDLNIYHAKNKAFCFLKKAKNPSKRTTQEHCRPSMSTGIKWGSIKTLGQKTQTSPASQLTVTTERLWGAVKPSRALQLLPTFQYHPSMTDFELKSGLSILWLKTLDYETDTKTFTQVHRAEATIQFLVILLQYILLFHKIHKTIKAKTSVWQKHSHVCFHVNTFS